MLKHFLSAQFAGFLAVGATAALLHWLTRIGLSQFLSLRIRKLQERVSSR